MARDGRAAAVIGVGALAGVGILLLARRAAAATIAPPRGRPPVSPEFPRGPIGRFPGLVERWRGEVERRAQDLPGDAILEWIRIESGGDMCSVGNPHEAGIFQLSFPDDARYGATLEELRAICEKSRHQDPADISWLSEGEIDAQVGAGIRKILAARDEVRRVFAQHGVAWPEASFDFGSAVKQIHAAPAVITELVPKITRRDGGAPASWADLRRLVMAFPVTQMGSGLQRLWNTASRRGLRNRLEDTMQNAEMVGHAWAASARVAGSVGHAWDHRWGGTWGSYR